MGLPPGDRPTQPQATQPATTIQEATGWQRTSDGTPQLIAAHPHSPLNAIDCLAVSDASPQVQSPAIADIAKAPAGNSP